MGPITLFDKSFLQSLSLDESVWFDNFFYTNICPLFFVETLADLEKAIRAGRTPEEEVGIIADKTPEMHGGPNAYHIELCIANLLGQSIPMEGSIIVSHGYSVKAHGRAGIIYRESKEVQAFRRWQEGEFLEVERLFARSWRYALSLHNPDAINKIARKMGVNSKCRSLEEAKLIADEIVESEDTPFERMKLVFLFLNLPRKIQIQVLKRWISSGSPPLSKYAPYVAYVLTVEIFFLIALGTNLISTGRVSNRVDIAYLFYLPFCIVFVSSDKLHRRCTHLFLRSNQDFV